MTRFFQQSERFSQQWLRNLYQHPALDQNLITPLNAVGRRLYESQQQRQRQQKIQALSQHYGLFFFFNSQCPYCHQMAPIVQAFSERYDWQVLPISLDGQPIDAFPKAQVNNGLAQKWQVKVSPSVFAVNPKTGHVLPLAQGLVTADELETRVMALTESPLNPGGLI